MDGSTPPSAVTKAGAGAGRNRALRKNRNPDDRERICERNMDPPQAYQPDQTARTLFPVGPKRYGTAKPVPQQPVPVQKEILETVEAEIYYVPPVKG